MYELLMKRLSPFRHVGFRRFFFVQSLSLVGTWAADLARSWIILSTMPSATALGGLLMASAVPGLFLSLHGGVLVDRLDIKRLIQSTKLLLGLISISLALMTELSEVSYWVLLGFALCEGIVSAFDGPAFQALVVRLVPRAEYQQAMALNSTNFHASRMLGPALAGLLMNLHGPSAVFLMDGLTYLGVALIIGSISIPNSKPKLSPQDNPWQALMGGFRYMAQNGKIRFIVLQLLTTIIFIYPLLNVVFRTYLKTKFQLSAQEFGLVFALPALGSMMGAIGFAVIQPKIPLKALLFGIPGAPLMMMLTMSMPTPPLAAWTLAFAGFFTYLSFASLTVSVQLLVDDQFRGRVSSVVALCFGSIGPLMGLPAGTIADQFGSENTVSSLGLIFLLLSGTLAFLHRKLRSSQLSAQ